MDRKHAYSFGLSVMIKKDSSSKFLLKAVRAKVIPGKWNAGRKVC